MDKETRRKILDITLKVLLTPVMILSGLILGLIALGYFLYRYMKKFYLSRMNVFSFMYEDKTQNEDDSDSNDFPAIPKSKVIFTKGTKK
jgi:hypothetical protein